MPARSRRKTRTIHAKATELAFAVPQVVAHRVARMAISGPTPSARDRREFALMVDEKRAAFTQAWLGMGSEWLRIYQSLALQFVRMAWSPWTWGWTTPGSLAAQTRNAVLGVLGTGMAPVHRKAVANAKRLSRTRLR
jgi:hypothetical protein